MATSHLTSQAKRERSTPNTISQDDSLSQNTRSKTQALLSAVEMSGSCPFARQSASRAFPLQFLEDFAAAVIDDENGLLLEYRHLIQRSKYKKAGVSLLVRISGGLHKACQAGRKEPTP